MYSVSLANRTFDTWPARHGSSPHWEDYHLWGSLACWHETWWNWISIAFHMVSSSCNCPVAEPLSCGTGAYIGISELSSYNQIHPKVAACSQKQEHLRRHLSYRYLKRCENMWAHAIGHYKIPWASINSLMDSNDLSYPLCSNDGNMSQLATSVKITDSGLKCVSMSEMGRHCLCMSLFNIYVPWDFPSWWGLPISHGYISRRAASLEVCDALECAVWVPQECCEEKTGNNPALRHCLSTTKVQ